MLQKRKLGIIGGSGIYKIEGFEKTKWKKIKTSWGTPSDDILLAKFSGEDICFIPRHSKGHKISPTNINFRANIDAMKQQGVTDILSISAVG
jgi:5'-methylthioadenosine phosphorylase